ncbi:uncharacterized protein LOC124621082 isoform X1 [Schistocerca americana]|uniref:uncharacterized protein LOC124621082 isoform X1 n=1 Tax=Schistocerca americana TaxID=7009 RepID=UPI001F4F8AD3|nr:uncharacterized protein LOC124621082 isoform X1 [Schistocerca americana]
MLKTKIYRNRVRIIYLIAFISLLYNEYLSYTMHRYVLWPNLTCEKSHECVSILFVADPQIIGEQFEMPFPIGTLARWDCDRYLRNTFTRAVSQMQPHAVIFLGDLMDEGSVATREEYQRYIERFFNIFHTPQEIQAIYNPGDNDIGGEDDSITEQKLQRYKLTFSQPDQIDIKNITVYKVNRLLYTFPQPELHTKSLSSKMSIIASHMPLLFTPNDFVRKVVKKLKPEIIFSAHDHKSLHTTMHILRPGDDTVIQALLPSSGPVWKFFLQTEIVQEIMVPTCSYRMGVQDVGYGAALFDLTDNTVLYTVLWLPYRFYHIISYVLLLLLIIFNLSLSLVAKTYRRISNGFKSCRFSHV